MSNIRNETAKISNKCRWKNKTKKRKKYSLLVISLARCMISQRKSDNEKAFWRRNQGKK